MTTFSVPEMSCGHCKAAIETAIASLDAGATVAVDLATRTVKITSTQPEGALIAAMRGGGYDATVIA